MISRQPKDTLPMPIKLVDSHVHFWDPQHLRYEWLAELPALNRPFLPLDMPLPEAGFTAGELVFVQADCAPDQGLREVAWVSELAMTDKCIQGIVAFAPLEQPTLIHAALDALYVYPLVKGIRRLIQSEAAGFAVQPDFIAGVRTLADYGYSFDLCVRHHQLADVVTLVKACPDVKFVLDHIGKPDIANRTIDPWRSQIDALAGLPNVWCKLSGLVTEADPDHWTPTDLQPYIAHVLAAFGPSRLMFGGDWPVVNLAGGYARWLAVVREALHDYTNAELNALFNGTARSFYRLP